MKVELYHTTSELKKLFRKEQNPRIAARIRAVYLALMDKTCPGDWRTARLFQKNGTEMDICLQPSRN